MKTGLNIELYGYFVFYGPADFSYDEYVESNTLWIIDLQTKVKYTWKRNERIQSIFFHLFHVSESKCDTNNLLRFYVAVGIVGLKPIVNIFDSTS